MYVRMLLGLVFIAAVSQPAAAQEAGDTGVTMGYPGAVGVVWHVSDRIALRPDITLARSTSESTATGTGIFEGPAFSSSSSSDGWGTTVGLSVLLNLRVIDRLRLYVAPRIAYSHSSTDSETGGTGALTAFNVTTKGLVTSGSFGTQYSLHDRFAVFGELGLQYTSLTSTSDFPGTRNDAEATTLGLRSAVGVTFYF